VVKKMNIKAYLKIKVINEKGKCIYYRRYRSRSFVINFLNNIFTNLSGQGITIINTSGSPYTAQNIDSIIVADKANDNNYGIQIGTGTTAPSITDTRLSQLITNGTGPGQMQYGGVNVTGAVTNTTNNTGYITVTRTFTNNSGASITVSEVGLVAFTGGYFISGAVQSNQFYLIIHDLLPTPITVPNGSSLSISYEIQVAT
jgi:hypothetical protein